MRPAPPQLKRVARARGEVVDVFSTAGVTYQLERVRCGKAKCLRCKKGPAHGPYWYGYFWSKGRTRSKYVGKNLPAALGAPVPDVGQEHDE